MMLQIIESEYLIIENGAMFFNIWDNRFKIRSSLRQQVPLLFY